MRWLAIVLAGCAIAGCASAGSQQPGVDSNPGGGDDSGNQMTDGSVTMPDAPPGPMTRTLSQTNSQTLTAGNTLACSNSTGTRANNFYRVFDLPALGITTPFTVNKVSFQVEHCHHNSGIGCTVAVRVGTYAATPGSSLNTADMAILASNATVTVPEIIESGTPPTTPGGTVDATINATIPANGKLLVVLEAPDGNNTYAFYPGTNTGGETAPGYIMSTTCSINAPLDMSGTLNGQATAAPRNLLLTVTGTY